MEGTLRRVVWLFREKPLVAWSLVSMAVSGSVVLLYRRFTQSSSGVKKLLTLPDGSMININTLLLPPSVILQRAVLETQQRASVANALVPLTSRTTVLPCRGIPFVLTLIDPKKTLQKNQAGGPSDTSSTSAPGKSTTSSIKRIDAFQTIDPVMLVANILVGSASAAAITAAAAPTTAKYYSIILNKFPVCAQHLVIVRNSSGGNTSSSSAYPSQAYPLEASDMTAMWHVLRNIDGIGFYNCGFKSGASQPRRHMQFIPLTSLQEQQQDSGVSSTKKSASVIPLDAAISTALEAKGWQSSPGEVFTIPQYAAGVDTTTTTFPHAVTMLGGNITRMSAEEVGFFLQELYIQLLHACGSHHIAEKAAASNSSSSSSSPPAVEEENDVFSHNVVLTRRWMFVVPRAQENWKDVSINSLGYAGFILARVGSEGEQQLKKEGAPIEALRTCAIGGEGV